METTIIGNISRNVLVCFQAEKYACDNGLPVAEKAAQRLVEDSARRPLSSHASGTAHRENSSWPAREQGRGGGAIKERDNSGAVAGELACLAGYLNMAGYLTGATCASTGNHQYHPHGHPAMGVGTHPHPHSHPHPGASHPALPSPFALATHGHPHAHPLEHGLSPFPQGESVCGIVSSFKPTDKKMM